MFVFAVITVSDSCYNEKAEDKSGPCLNRLLYELAPQATIFCEIVPDDKVILQEKLIEYADRKEVHAVFTTGGTGFSPRDVTPEATREVIHRECPQLALAMALESFKKTPFAALSRAVSGIRYRTLIVNFPGSVRAVQECFGAIKMVLPHAIQLLRDDLEQVKEVHQQVQQHVHVCPHKTGTGDRDDRNSPYPMLPLNEALEIVLKIVQRSTKNSDFFRQFPSPVDIPPFRASVKDGYALKSAGFPGVRKVVGCIAAGDDVAGLKLEDDECFKINTGAPLPDVADCVIQVEDTKLLKVKNDGTEELVEILTDPQPLLDVRSIGCDLKKGSLLFPGEDNSDVVFKALLSSVGQIKELEKPKVVVLSTGSELLDPRANQSPSTSKIFDSNTTMLVELLKYFGFECVKSAVVRDDIDSVRKSIKDVFKLANFVVCTGGVSMGDKDYIKPVLKDLGFTIHFGRVNMKPGKPMTFASSNEKYFFGLPGNPVSAFVTFHLFALPALRWASGWDRNKCELSTINVKLGNEEIFLDPRPEFARASITSRDGVLFATITGNQMSSRLQSIVGADVLLHLPGRSNSLKSLRKGESLTASVLRYDFISKYE